MEKLLVEKLEKSGKKKKLHYQRTWFLAQLCWSQQARFNTYPLYHEMRSQLESKFNACHWSWDPRRLLNATEHYWDPRRLLNAIERELWKCHHPGSRRLFKIFKYPRKIFLKSKSLFVVFCKSFRKNRTSSHVILDNCGCIIIFFFFLF